MRDLHVVVLAAGKGTRMRSTVPKVLHSAAGLPLIARILRTAESLHPQSIVIVVGHEAEQVEAAVGKRPGLGFAMQEPQLGTGHGRRETSHAQYVNFERASSAPAELITLYYDSHRNLVAKGVIRDVAPAPLPRPFPGFVPDPGA